MTKFLKKVYILAMAFLDFLKNLFGKKEPAPSSPSESQNTVGGPTNQEQGSQSAEADSGENTNTPQS